MTNSSCIAYTKWTYFIISRRMIAVQLGNALAVPTSQTVICPVGGPNYKLCRQRAPLVELK